MQGRNAAVFISFLTQSHRLTACDQQALWDRRCRSDSISEHVPNTGMNELHVGARESMNIIKVMYFVYLCITVLCHIMLQHRSSKLFLSTRIISTTMWTCKEMQRGSPSPIEMIRGRVRKLWLRSANILWSLKQSQSWPKCVLAISWWKSALQ